MDITRRQVDHSVRSLLGYVKWTGNTAYLLLGIKMPTLFTIFNCPSTYACGILAPIRGDGCPAYCFECFVLEWRHSYSDYHRSYDITDYQLQISGLDNRPKKYYNNFPHIPCDISCLCPSTLITYIQRFVPARQCNNSSRPMCYFLCTYRDLLHSNETDREQDAPAGWPLHSLVPSPLSQSGWHCKRWSGNYCICIFPGFYHTTACDGHMWNAFCRMCV